MVLSNPFMSGGRGFERNWSGFDSDAEGGDRLP